MELLLCNEIQGDKENGIRYRYVCMSLCKHVQWKLY